MANKSHYKTQTRFWSHGDEVRIMGHLIGRPQALKLLDPQPDEVILDAGCGTGYMARKIARKGAEVLGFDKSWEMLKSALNQLEEDSKITYLEGEIDEFPFHRPLNKILCSSVLMHCTPDQIDSFYEQANKYLRLEGSLVLNLPHPSLYLPGIPTSSTNKDPCWIKLKQLNKSTPLTRSQRFEETYTDIEGKKFESKVWHHPLEIYIVGLNRAGFEITDIVEPIVEKHHLLHPSWGTATGYHSHLVVKAVKTRRI